MSRLVVIAALGQPLAIGETIVLATPLKMRGYAELQQSLQKHKPGAKIHDPEARDALFEIELLQKQLLQLCLSKHHPEVKEEPGLVDELWEEMAPSQFADLVGIAFRRWSGSPETATVSPAQDERDRAK